MNRKEFLATCGGTCIGLLGLSVLNSCKPTRHVQALENTEQLIVDKTEFLIIGNNKTRYRRSVVIRSATSVYPIALYRISETEYRALLLRCSHQGSELDMNGDILSCPAHGSEFNNKGEAIQGPAEQALRSFAVKTDEHKIYIHLK